ncbi:ketosamine-3-kinase-like isoform X2 [Dysidea avara]|uniref:ketosamine-3-kinase-like isoform X2 n=1 Tax=Dysidea avara TaxID=196820 RepID=UPI00332CE86B
MEKLLKETLQTSTLSLLGQFSGCIAKDAAGYEIDEGKKIFVKNGVLAHPEDAASHLLVTEYINMKSLSKYQAKLGEQLARLHLHNQTSEQPSDTVNQFGFEVPTCCGAIPLDNTWSSDWVEFYTRQRIEPQIAMVEKKFGDNQARQLWTQLLPKIPNLFNGLMIKPALLHGDLWSGNAAETDFEPVVFDPASFYGHSEFDLSITTMFGGFSGAFYSAYHQLIPKYPGFDKRQQLYLLFHYLNHWNHFGSGYKSQSLTIMQKLL